jgi:hypothetical protein
LVEELPEELPVELLPPDERLLPADDRELEPDDRDPEPDDRELPTDRDCGAEERLGLLRTELEERELGARVPAELRLGELPRDTLEELERGTITGLRAPVRPELDRGVTSVREPLDEVELVDPELDRGANSWRDPLLDEVEPVAPENASLRPEYMVGR